MTVKKQTIYIIILIIGFFAGSMISNVEYNLFNINKLIKKVNMQNLGSNKYKTNSEKLRHILELIDNNYVDSINYKKFEDDVVNTLLKNLDPHSSYISVDDFKNVKEDMQGSFSGIGIEFKIIEDTIVVVSAISGGPSEKLGIQSGDRIIAVEDKNVANIGITNEDVINSLRGEKGSSVKISIKRNKEKKLLPFKIIRDDIPLVSVDAGFMLTNEIGLIKINRFAANTYNEMIKKTDSLKMMGMKKLILDLRSNPGGYLHVANKICDEFLKANELIVYTEGDKRGKLEYHATSTGNLEETEIAVLINEGSASASEIVAGAIQDNDRGIIIGKRSFGKGLVQEQIILNDGSVIRLTTQRYFTPSGRCIQTQYRNATNNNTIDSLKYFTKEGRIVYGGGGINPDLIIYDDTSENYSQINQLLYSGIINDFCLDYSINLRRNKINNYTQINVSNLYNKFILNTKNKNQNLEINLGETELKFLKNLLLATTARNIWGSNIYHQIISEEDKYVQIAITKLSLTN